MSPAQTNLYFFEWGRVRKHFLAKGIDSKQADNKRHALHNRALGRDKSSKVFSNAELDKVIAAFRAVSDGGNLDAQMRVQDSPDVRRASIERRIEAALDVVFVPRDPEFAGLARNRYLDGTAKRICGKMFALLTDAERAKVMGALERSARVKKSQQQYAEAARGEAADGNPF